jgi:hypothetical protein
VPDAVSIATLAAGAAGGAFVAIVTGLIRFRIERSQQLREPRLAAADDYATGVQQALDCVGRLKDYATTETGTDELVELARRISEADARLARVILLFGPA